LAFGLVVRAARAADAGPAAGGVEFHTVVGPETTLPDAQYSQWVDRLRRDGPAYTPGDAVRWFEVWRPDDYRGRMEQWNGRRYVLASVRPADSLDGNSGKWALTRVGPTRDGMGMLVVGFELDPAGAVLFGNLTASHVHSPLGIVVDGRLVSAPTINSPIPGGKGIITGGGPNGFSAADADYLVRAMGGPFDRTPGDRDRRMLIVVAAGAGAVVLLGGIGAMIYALTRRRAARTG
jgi:hypothetical protein